MKIKLKSVNDFKKILLTKGFTQRGLGRAIDISEVYSTQIANGTRNPGPEIAKRIVDLLEVEFTDVFFVSESDKSNLQEAK